jgi:hypothetical protein
MNLALIELMDQLHQDYESMVNDLKRSIGSEVVTVTMDGGGLEDLK